MKIVEMRGFWVEYPMPEPIRNSLGAISTRSSLIVEVVGEDGTSGWGETQRHPTAAWSVIETVLARAVWPHSAFEREAVWREMMGSGGDTLVSLAASAIDIALWDLCGRVLGQPIANLLGGFARTQLVAYASGPFMKEGPDPYRDMLKEVENYLAAGFVAVKPRCGLSPRDDAELLLRIRSEFGPELALMADINKGYSRTAASELVRSCAPADLGWIEEPLNHLDLEGYRALSSISTVPIAAGEALSDQSQFHDFITGGALDIVQPDIYLCGGISGAIKIASLADTCKVAYLPHVFGAAVNFYASLQLAAVVPEHRLADDRHYPMFEFDQSDNLLRTVAGMPAVDANGCLLIPDGPGIGVEISREMWEPFTRQAWRVEP